MYCCFGKLILPINSSWKSCEELSMMCHKSTRKLLKNFQWKSIRRPKGEEDQLSKTFLCKWFYLIISYVMKSKKSNLNFPLSFHCELTLVNSNNDACIKRESGGYKIMKVNPPRFDFSPLLKNCRSAENWAWICIR